jgi:hypothetical protein
MKVAFHVAGTISPLVILIPSGWSNYQIGREHLLTVCVILDLLLSLSKPTTDFLCFGK